MSLAEAVHRIQLREGTADPVVLHLNPGQPIGPIDIGAMGHWRVTAEGVADKHAYLFFDGSQLFLRSIHAETPVVANGHALPSDWVPVEAPCAIALGGALLWFELLEEEISGEVIDEDTDNDVGAVATRVVPLQEMMEKTSATRRAVLEKLLRAPTPPSGIHALPRVSDHTAEAATRHYQPPYRGRDDLETATSLADMSEPRSSQRGLDGPPASMPTPTEHLASGPQSGRLGYDPMGSGSGSMARPRTGSLGSGSLGTSPLAGTGSMGSDGPPVSGGTIPSPFAPTDPAQQPMPLFGMDLATGKFSDPPPLSPWQRMSFPRKAIIILFLPMVASVIVLFTDVLRLKGAPATRGSAAPSASASSPTPAARATTQPDEPPEKPDVPEPEAMLPVASNAPPIESATPNDHRVVGPKSTEGEKTLQRRAVDAFVAGSYDEAARLYDELAKKHPENPAYAAAAGIARAKMAPK